MHTRRLCSLLANAGWRVETARVASNPSPELLETIAIRADKLTLSERWSMSVERIRDEASRLLWGDCALSELVKRREARS